MRILTVAIWTVSLGCILVAGAVALEFVLMPVSLDFGEILAAGSEPWRDAALAAGGFTALLVTAAVGLRLWHTARFKLLAWVLTGAELAAVSWIGALIYREYL